MVSLRCVRFDQRRARSRIMLRRQHASGSCRLVLLLLLGVDAQFPFGDPPPPPAGPPPGMGELLSEVQLLEDPQQLKELIGSPVVSLILFTEGEEETLETQWFMFFSTVVEKSIDVAAGDARVNWGMADNARLRKSSACVVQPRESRSRSTHSLPCLRRYYDVHPREQDALHSSSPRTHVHTCLLIIYSFSSCSCVCVCACACVCVCAQAVPGAPGRHLALLRRERRQWNAVAHEGAGRARHACRRDVDPRSARCRQGREGGRHLAQGAAAWKRHPRWLGSPRRE